MQQKESLDRITKLLLFFSDYLKIQNGNGQYDVNIIGEDIMVQLLNIVFDASFTNRKYETGSSEFPGIDLGDEKRRICVQVTSKTDFEKVKHTAEQIKKHQLYLNYDTFLIYFLTSDKVSFKSFTAIDKIADGMFTLDKSSVLTHIVLYKKIASMPLGKILEVERFLEMQFGNSDQSKREQWLKTVNSQLIALREKFKLGKERISEREIIKALCSNDADLRRFAVFEAMRQGFKGGNGIIHENIHAEEPMLKLASIRAISSLRIDEAIPDLPAFFDDPDDNIRNSAINTYFFSPATRLTQENLEIWLDWLAGPNIPVREKIIEKMYHASFEGRLDVASITEYLLRTLPGVNAMSREYIYYMFLNVEGISDEIDLGKELEKELEDRFVCNVIAELLLVEGKDKLLADHLNNLINKKRVTDRSLEHIISVARLSKHPDAKKVCAKFSTLYRKSFGEEFEWYAKFLQERVFPKQNAIRPGQRLTEVRGLSENQKIDNFIAQNKKGNALNRFYGHAFLVNEESRYTTNGVSHYLCQYKQFTEIDFRNKKEHEVDELLHYFGSVKRIVLRLESPISTRIESVLRSLYDAYAVSFYDREEYRTIRFEKDLLLVFLMEKEDYEKLYKDNYGFRRMIWHSLEIE